MRDVCPECGAAVPEGGSCRDNFHALLLLESEIPGAAGSLPHFYAVASYVLQHPDTMHYTPDALGNLRVNLTDSLDGRATLEEILRRTRHAANGSVRDRRVKRVVLGYKAFVRCCVHKPAGSVPRGLGWISRLKSVEPQSTGFSSLLCHLPAMKPGDIDSGHRTQVDRSLVDGLLMDCRPKFDLVTKRTAVEAPIAIAPRLTEKQVHCSESDR